MRGGDREDRGAGTDGCADLDGEGFRDAVGHPEQHAGALDDVALAARLYKRVRPALPDYLCGMRAKGANERFRAYRYDVGQRFAPHYDGSFQRSDREESQLTFMVYLNDNFDGGSTQFYSFDKDLGVRPQTGMALLFQHRLLHEGSEVRRGVKYVVRSDVMYERS